MKYCIVALVTLYCCIVACSAQVNRGNCTSHLWPTPGLSISCPYGRVIRIGSVTKVTLRSQTGCFFGPMSCVNPERQLRFICHWRPSCQWASDDISSACPVRINYACVVGSVFAQPPSTEALPTTEESSGQPEPEVHTDLPDRPTTTDHVHVHQIEDVDNEVDDEVDEEEDEDEEDEIDSSEGDMEGGPVINRSRNSSSGNAYVIVGLVLLALVVILVPLIIIIRFDRRRKRQAAAADYKAIGETEKTAEGAVENGQAGDSDTKPPMDDGEKEADMNDDEKTKLTEENEMNEKDGIDEDVKPAFDEVDEANKPAPLQ